jgi:hypothetical protein
MVTRYGEGTSARQRDAPMRLDSWVTCTARTVLQSDLQFYWLALSDGAFWSRGFQKSSPLG